MLKMARLNSKVYFARSQKFAKVVHSLFQGFFSSDGASTKDLSKRMKRLEDICGN